MQKRNSVFMKKILLIAIGILALTISACGTRAEATPPQPTAAPEIFPATAAPAEPTPATGAATAAPTQAPVAGASFAKDVAPILNNYCIKCHGIEQVKEGLDMTSYEKLMAGSFNGTVIAPGNAGESLLADMILKGKMPKRGAKPSAAEIQVIINWINAGALNN
jgi:hypothetical protein